VFQTFPFFGIKAIAGLISINLHLCKLSGQAQLRAHSLSYNHILHTLLESRPFYNHTPHSLSLDSLTCHQRENIKGTIIDMDNRVNEVFPSFNPLNIEFSPSSCLIDIFPSCFSFHPFIKCSNNNLEDHSNQFNDIAIMSLLNHSHTLIISDTGIKNNIATSIAHIHIYDSPIIKRIYHAANVTSTEAKLFAIRCGINRAVNLAEISKIVIVTDAAKKIFDSVIHLFQIYSTAISKKLRKCFLTNSDNSIAFWECSS